MTRNTHAPTVPPTAAARPFEEEEDESRKFTVFSGEYFKDVDFFMQVVIILYVFVFGNI